MPDIFHSFPIAADIEAIFDAISTPKGLDNWWTQTSSGSAALGEIFSLHFAPDYYWDAVVSGYTPLSAFELTMQTADDDWKGTQVGFHLDDKGQMTEVHFYHTGWKTDNAHYRFSNFCWAMYLRIMKRYIEWGEFVPYVNRLDV